MVFFLFGVRKMYDFNLICIKHFLRTEKVAGLVKVIVCNLTLLLLFKCDNHLNKTAFVFGTNVRLVGMQSLYQFW